MSDVFISYKSEDRPLVERLCNALEAAGFSVWFDRDLQAGTRFSTEIVKQILQAHVVVAVISAKALHSKWVEFECLLGVRSGKELFVINAEPSVIRNHRLHKELQHLHIEALRDEATTVSHLEKFLNTVDLPPRLWTVMSNRGIDIDIPREVFVKRNDPHLGLIEGVNSVSINTSLELQHHLIGNVGHLSYGGIINRQDPVRVRFLPDDAVSLLSDRNHVILGGPGGVPLVHILLMGWAKVSRERELTSGYRFVTDRGRFEPGPFLRAAEKVGRGGRTGIEDVRRRRTNPFFEYREPTRGRSGRNFVIVYTMGLNDHAPNARKVVVWAAFNRDVLPGAVDFLLDRSTSNEWLQQVQELGTTCTESLIEFDVVGNGQLEIHHRHAPRPLGA